MQVQHHPGPGLLGRGERAPPVGRVDVVRVHDPRSVRLTASRDLFGVQPAADEPERRVLRADRGRIALEHLHVLVQMLADEPLQVRDRPFLPADMAIAVVEEQDHAPRG